MRGSSHSWRMLGQAFWAQKAKGRRSMKRWISGSCLALCCVGLVGCGAAADGEDDNAAAESDSPDELDDVVRTERFETRNGGLVEVTLESEGALNLSIVEPAMSQAVLEAYAEGRADIVDLYLDLSGEFDVPSGILEMNELYLAAQAAADSTEIEEVIAEETFEPTHVPHALDIAGAPDLVRADTTLERIDLSESAFVERYCIAGWYLHCWPRVTGTGYIQRKAHMMITHAYAVQGSILHRIQTKATFGKWKDRLSNVVHAGYLSYLYRNDRANTRGGVWDADGDVYHLSIEGIW